MVVAILRSRPRRCQGACTWSQTELSGQSRAMRPGGRVAETLDPLV